MYKFLDDGVHAKVLDVPGTISFGKNLTEARSMLADALVDTAETNLMFGDPLPQPDSSATGDDADVEEPIHPILSAASRVSIMPDAAPV